LQIRILARSSKATELNDALGVRLNNDSGSNYRSHTLQAQGTNASIYAGASSGTYAF
jgi:hypothetical protein